MNGHVLRASNGEKARIRIFCGEHRAPLAAEREVDSAIDQEMVSAGGVRDEPISAGGNENNGTRSRRDTGDGSVDGRGVIGDAIAGCAEIADVQRRLRIRPQGGQSGNKQDQNPDDLLPEAGEACHGGKGNW